MSERRFENDVHRDYYQRLRKRVTNWTVTQGPPQEYLEYFLAAPDLFHLLVKLSVDSKLSWSSRAKLAGTVAYLVSPIDLLPETILGPVGLLDDIGLTAYVLRETMDEVGREHIRKHWAGRRDVLIFVEDIIDLVVEELGLGSWKKIISSLESIR